MQHMFLLGQTGTGKSTLLEHMILQDIQAGIGIGVIDPHGDLVDDILGKVPYERIQDVILFDLLDEKRPIGLNILQVDSRYCQELCMKDQAAIRDSSMPLTNFTPLITSARCLGLLSRTHLF